MTDKIPAITTLLRAYMALTEEFAEGVRNSDEDIYSQLDLMDYNERVAIQEAAWNEINNINTQEN